MTSEVLMLNKDAVVIAADSAVTTGRAPHPRYSKSANKIFDLTAYGNAALNIYANADIDRVPWELAIKMYRAAQSGAPQEEHLVDYRSALLNFLQGNQLLFPSSVLKGILEKRLISGVSYVLDLLGATEPQLMNVTADAQTRKQAWVDAVAKATAFLEGIQIFSGLTAADVQQAMAVAPAVEVSLIAEVQAEPKYAHVELSVLVKMAVNALVKVPDYFLPSTGVVISGYGAQDIFPGFTHFRVFGHIGASLAWKEEMVYTITHDNEAWIQPFAQSSMIERFTDGFDSSLMEMNGNCANQLISRVIGEIRQAGVDIPQPLIDQISSAELEWFKKEFRKRNWDQNFYPLRRVLNSLSVQEMGHLAESLLVLEELRERVTSPSESVGGPIDVAVVTKAEGLVWLKRKHYFDPALNLRYLSRSRN